MVPHSCSSAEEFGLSFTGCREEESGLMQLIGNIPGSSTHPKLMQYVKLGSWPKIYVLLKNA